MKTVAYIQARGGSRRIPGKNKYLWKGKPFVVDAIHKAQMADLFDLIVVSSDDIEILDLAREAGAMPMLRSKETSGDFVTDDTLAWEILKPLTEFDIACKLYPCVPLLDPEDLRKAYFMFIDDSVDALRSVDTNGADAGAFWFYRIQPALEAKITELSRIDYVLDVCQDINTLDDIEQARRKDEHNRLLGR